MKRLSLLMAMVVLIGFSAFSQQPTHQKSISQIQKISGQMKHITFGKDRPTIDTFGNLQPCDTVFYIWTFNPAYGGSGGLSGHNSFLDSSKAEQYQGVPGTKIDGFWMFFGTATSTSTTQKIHVRAWDATGAGGTPGAQLGNVDVTHASIKTDIAAGNLTTVYFPTPLTMPAGGNFYAGFTMDYRKVSGHEVYDSTRAVNLVNPDLFSDCNDSASNTAWEQLHYSTNPANGDGKWHSYFEDLGVGTRNPVFVIVENNACTVTISPSSASICKGKSTSLTASASGGGGTWTWAPATGLNVTTGATVNAKPTATTTYTATNSGGCSGTVTVTVTAKPTATVTSDVCSSGHELLHANANPSSGVTYKWFLNNAAIPGATMATYLANTSGAYKVKVTITATGCVTTSKNVNIVISCRISAVNPLAFDATAYPNPFTNSVSINISTGSSEVASVTLLDFSGRTLRTFSNIDPAVPFEINENLTAGVYFVKVAQGTSEKMIKVVKSE